MKKKYILQYGNIAGWPYYYALSLRNIGYNSTSIKPMEEELGGYPGNTKLDRKLPSDITLFNLNTRKMKRKLLKVKLFGNVLNNCSLVHYHGGTILQKQFDARFFKLKKIPLIISWAGGEARIVNLARKNNPYFYRELNQEWDNQIKRNLESIARVVDYVATDPEMAEYSTPFFKKVFLLKQPIDLSEINYCLPSVNNNLPKLLHIPTHPEVKGTKFIINAVDRLKDEGFKFEFFKLDSILTQKQVKSELSKCDVYIDELRCGSYGVTAVEAMACGKPTITFIREDLVEKYPPELPIINANPDTIYEKLKLLLQNPELRYETGKKSRAYIEKYHALEVIGPELIKVYTEIGFKDSL